MDQKSTYMPGSKNFFLLNLKNLIVTISRLWVEKTTQKKKKNLKKEKNITRTVLREG